MAAPDQPVPEIRTVKGYSLPGEGSSTVISIVSISSLFALWWVGSLHFPGLMHVELLGADATVTAAPNWSTLFAPILVYA